MKLFWNFFEFLISFKISARGNNECKMTARESYRHSSLCMNGFFSVRFSLLKLIYSLCSSSCPPKLGHFCVDGRSGWSDSLRAIPTTKPHYISFSFWRISQIFRGKKGKRIRLPQNFTIFVHSLLFVFITFYSPFLNSA